MFIVGQPILPKVNNQTKKGLFETGIGLAKPSNVKIRFTYRELTLLLGIVVALVVVFKILLNQGEKRSLPVKHSSSYLQEIIKPVADRILMKTTYACDLLIR